MNKEVRSNQGLGHDLLVNLLEAALSASPWDPLGVTGVCPGPDPLGLPAATLPTAASCSGQDLRRLRGTAAKLLLRSSCGVVKE